MQKFFLRDSDFAANRFVLKTIAFSSTIFGIIWLLNILGIFVVEQNLMNLGFFGSVGISALMVIISKICGLNNPKIKYVLLLVAAINFDFIGIVLSYHALLATIIPLLLAVQYKRNSFLRYAYLITAIGYAGTVYGSYYFGLCNANMLLFTQHQTQYYLDLLSQGALVPDKIEIPINMALLVFFVVPQWFILLALVPILFHISKHLEGRVHGDALRNLQQDRDFMTGLKNRTNYMNLVKNYYPTINKISVISWNIDNLRYTNDTLGHDCGDILIAVLADSIKQIIDENCRAFRLSGDDFLLVIENSSKDSITKALLKWNIAVDDFNRKSNLKLRASMGYAEGNGPNIESLVIEAKRLMFKFKKTNKMEVIQHNG